MPGYLYERLIHTAPRKISDHQFLFLTDWYFAAEIWYFIKKINQNDNANFMMKKDKEKQKKHSLFWTSLICEPIKATNWTVWLYQPINLCQKFTWQIGK